MAKVEIKKQLFLTTEEVDTLRKARLIFIDIDNQDCGGDIFCQADNHNTEWTWLVDFIENLIFGSEVK